MHHEHFQYGNIGAMRFDEGDVARCGLRFDHDWLEMRQCFDRLQLLLNIVQSQAQTIGNLGKQAFHLLRVIAEQQDAKRRVIINDDASIAVQHGTARSDDGNGPNSVTLSKLRIAIGIDDLQFPETQQKQGHKPHKRVGDDSQPHLRQTVFILKPEGQANSAPAARPSVLSLPFGIAKYTAITLIRQNLAAVPESLFRRFGRTRPTYHWPLYARNPLRFPDAQSNKESDATAGTGTSSAHSDDPLRLAKLIQDGEKNHGYRGIYDRGDHQLCFQIRFVLPEQQPVDHYEYAIVQMKKDES